MDIPHVDDKVRIAPALRERAVEVTRQAAADGRIEFDELGGRVGRCLEARTQGDLRAVLGDLIPSADLEAFLREAPPMLSGPGSTWDDPLYLKAVGFQALKREGAWEVPPFIEVMGTSMNTIMLNFLEAIPLASVIDIVAVTQGTLTIIVPEGWGVDVERVAGTSQGMFSTRVATRPTKGLPRIVLSGQIVMGKVRYASPRSCVAWSNDWGGPRCRSCLPAAEPADATRRHRRCGRWRLVACPGARQPRSPSVVSSNAARCF